MRKNNILAFFILGMAILLAILASIGLYFSMLPPRISDISIGDVLNEDNTLTLTVKFKSIYDENSCYITLDDEDMIEDNWTLADGLSCKFNVKAGKYNIFIKDKTGKITSTKTDNIEINRILSIKLDTDEVYVASNGKYTLKADLTVLGDIDESLKWYSSDESILTVEDGVINPVNVGDSTVKVVASDGKSAEALVHVTNMIVSPVIDNTKPKLKCKQFTEEEAKLLDTILFNKVAYAGEGTRAGVLAAVRFLALEFPYRVEYFFENGRLNNYGNKSHVDGEGRYFHKGLYLSESKFETIEASKAGPAIWGCPLTNWQDESYYKPGVKYPNGLDCSGFVSWSLYNGGMNIKDSGAGENSDRDDDMDDQGEKVKLTQELIDSRNFKAGDLIGRNGHIAIIAGVDDEYIYVAESLIGGVKVVQFKLKGEIISCNKYAYIIRMDNEYSSDGNGFTNMWG